VRDEPTVSAKELLDEFPREFIKYPHALDLIRRVRAPETRDAPLVHFLLGPTGVGKSKRALEEHPGAYWKAPDEWWSDYDGASDIIIDDFYGWLPFHELLRLLDRYPMRLNAKGSHISCNCKCVVITSNKPPRAWYRPEVLARYSLSALLRRITKLSIYSADGSHDEYEGSEECTRVLEEFVDFFGN